MSALNVVTVRETGLRHSPKVRILTLGCILKVVGAGFAVEFKLTVVF